MSDPLIRVFWRMKEWWENGTDEDAERAICRAAAEISGLRAELAYSASLASDLEWETRDAVAPLRRFAELAKEE